VADKPIQEQFGSAIINTVRGFVEDSDVVVREECFRELSQQATVTPSFSSRTLRS
jgi:hypothetical protein